MLFLEFGSARFSDNHRKQSFLSLGSDDTADLEPWCTAIIIEIPAILLTISIDDRKVFLNSFWCELNDQNKIYTASRGVNTAAVQYSTRCLIDSSYRFATCAHSARRYQTGMSGDSKERADELALHTVPILSESDSQAPS
jgi:hypothetical protein